MDTNQEKWQQCLQMIQQQLKDEWIFTTWFRPLACDSYDTQQRILTLQVPSRYVYEFIEHYYVRLLAQVVARVYGEGVTLRYRLLQNGEGAPVDFTLSPPQCVPVFRIPDAADRLRRELTRCVRGQLEWLPAYDKVAGWLSDNKGRGLLLIGTTGLGKSLICRDVLPAVFQHTLAYADASELHSRLEELIRKRCVIIDNLGREPAKVFGQPDRSFLKLCDAAERNGILLIIATSLSTTPVSDPRYQESIQQRYGSEVLSRLRSLVLPVELEGRDMRR